MTVSRVGSVTDVAFNRDSDSHLQRSRSSRYSRCCAAPTVVHWREALGILGHVRRTSAFGISFQKGTVGGLSLEVFDDAGLHKYGSWQEVLVWG